MCVFTHNTHYTVFTLFIYCIHDIFLYTYDIYHGNLPSRHKTLQQCRDLVEIRSLRRSKVNFDTIPTSTACWVVSRQC